MQNMDVSRWVFVVLIFAAACSNQSEGVTNFTPQVAAPNCQETIIPNRFLVEWTDGTITSETATNAEVFVRDIGKPQKERIRFVEFDQMVSIDSPEQVIYEYPSDDWGLLAAKVPEAWAKGSDGLGIVVAIVDTGLDISHPQLANQLATNTNELLNGKDDDNNGFVDDLSGWDFVNNTGTLTDENGHGTHVSGIVASDPTKALEGKPTPGGVAPKSKLLPLKFLGDKSGSIGEALKAIQYAIDRKVHVINASWGGTACSLTLKRLIQKAGEQGIVFVAAAGNDGSDLAYDPAYPAAFSLSNQITVGAVTHRGLFAGFSNRGNLVQLAAPGTDILSTWPVKKGGVAYEHGTSMAAPFVSGAAAILLSHKLAPPETIVRALINSVSQGVCCVASNGQLNVSQGLDELDRLTSATSP